GTRTRAAGIIPAGSVGQPATTRSSGVAGSTEPDDRGTEPGDPAGSGEVSRSASTDDPSRCWSAHRTGLRADHRRSRPLSVREAGGQLSRTGAAQQIPSLDDATRAENRQGRDGAKTSGAPVLDDASGMGLPAVDQIRFARGTARKSPWCAVEHRAY